MSDFESRARSAADAVKREMDRTNPDDDRGLRHARRSRKRAVVPALAAVFLVAGLSTQLPINNGNNGHVASNESKYQLASSLQPFDRCDTVLQYFKDNAKKEFHNVDSREIPPMFAAPNSGSAKSEAADTANTRPSSGLSSTTNVQEAGVDEPDVVKTDGKRIVAVAGGRASLIDDNGGHPQVRSTLSDLSVNNVFFEGDRVLVFAAGTNGYASLMALYDVRDLTSPHLVANLSIDGSIVDARMVGTQVRVVTNTTPSLNGAAYRGGSDDQLRERIANSKVEDWTPEYSLRDSTGKEVDRGQLVDCNQLSRPKTFSGISTVALTSFDLDSSMKDSRSVGVIASGQQVYATAGATYVSSTDFEQFQNPQATYVHKFTTDRHGESTYRASGQVSGQLLNQYSMSENNGVLRIASTVRSNSTFVARRNKTGGAVTTLRESNGELEQLGLVGGLGESDNESIKAVRFIGERAYVVTFRQMDPLYVVDLRDPKAPKVSGELKIPGYSGYLHPVGENLVLGVGQDAGVQFSLFDVSDPANPKRIGTQSYGSGSAAAEFDPKAFLFWQPRNLVIAPTTFYEDKTFTGLVLLQPGNNALLEVGRLAFTGKNGSITRTFVIDNRAYMLSDDGLQVNSLDTHRDIDRLQLPTAQIK